MEHNAHRDAGRTWDLLVRFAVIEHLYLCPAFDELGELGVESGRANGVVVHPVIIASAWFVVEHTVVAKPVLVQPPLSNFCKV